MSNQVSNKQIIEYFFNINRILTIGLVLILAIISTLLWLSSVSLQSISIWVGIVLMLVAVVFYRIPWFSYLLTRKHFIKLEILNNEVLNSGWVSFKKWLEIQSSS